MTFSSHNVNMIFNYCSIVAQNTVFQTYHSKTIYTRKTFTNKDCPNVSKDYFDQQKSKTVLFGNSYTCI